MLVSDDFTLIYLLKTLDREQSSQKRTASECEPEVNLLQGVDCAGRRQSHERVDGVEEALLLVRLQDEDGEPQEQRRRVQVPLARVGGGAGGGGRVGQEGVAEGLSCGWQAVHR